MNSIKRQICDVKTSQLEHDLPTSVNGSDFTRVYCLETSQPPEKYDPHIMLEQRH